MPMSKPSSARAFADSCPIPESEAVTMATGLILLPPYGCLLLSAWVYVGQLPPGPPSTNRIRWKGYLSQPTSGSSRRPCLSCHSSNDSSGNSGKCFCQDVRGSRTTARPRRGVVEHDAYLFRRL